MLKRAWNGLVGWLRGHDWGWAVDRQPQAMSTTEIRYIRSFVWLRIAVGIVGILLPIALWFFEWRILNAPVHVRDSLSSYYHSAARDWFVASLAVIGVLLITYMTGMWRSVEFVFSTIAGIALLGVAFFPTERPHLLQGAPLCQASPKPPDCTELEHRWGEHLWVGDIHLACACIALVSLGLIAFLWAGRAQWGNKRKSDSTLSVIHAICGSLIATALIIALTGWISPWREPVFHLTPFYIGEVVTVLAFGVSWVVQGLDLRRWLKTVTPS
jgi:xanthine/uracil permease